MHRGLRPPLHVAEQLCRPHQLPLLLRPPVQHSPPVQRAIWHQPIPLHPELPAPQLDTALAAAALSRQSQSQWSQSHMATERNAVSNPCWPIGRPLDIPFSSAMEGHEHL